MAQPFTGTQTNAYGVSLSITSQTLGGMIAAPFSICFVDPNGNEYSTSNGVVGSEQQAPVPVVLSNSLGQPITMPVTITSNGNTITINNSLTGRKLGQPLVIMLTDVNGNAVTISGSPAVGTFINAPASCVLTDINGKSVTATFSGSGVSTNGFLLEDSSGVIVLEDGTSILLQEV